MNKIGVLIGKDFEDSEYTRPAEEFKKAGYTLVHVGLKQGDVVKGKKEGTPVKIDMDAKNARPQEFDALLIPGGYSPDNLRAYDEPVRFVREFMQSGKPVFAICHAPQLLITAQTLKGRKITGWKSIIVDIKNAGADFYDREVVEDGNLISSRSPADIPAFVEAALKKLASSRSVVEVEHGKRSGRAERREAA
jgi:protease I